MNPSDHPPMQDKQILSEAGKPMKKFRKKPIVISAIQFTGMNQRDIVEAFGYGLHDDHPFRWVGWDQLKIKTSAVARRGRTRIPKGPSRE